MSSTRIAAWLAAVREDTEGASAALAAEVDPEEARLASFAFRSVEGASAAERLLRIGAGMPLVARAAVLDALVVMGDGSVLRRWWEREPDPWLCRMAARGAMRTDPALWRTLQHDPRGALRAAASEEVRRRDLWVESEADPQDPVDEVAWTAAAAWRARGATPPLILGRGPFLEAQSRRAPRISGPDDLEAVRALDDRDPSDVARAAEALFTLADETALVAVVGRLAASELPIATDALVMGVHHPVEAVAAACTRALDGRSGDSVWRAYADRARHAPWIEVRRAILWTVSRRSEVEGLALLLSAAELPGLEHAAAEGLAYRVRRTARSRTPEVRQGLERLLNAADPVLVATARDALARY